MKTKLNNEESEEELDEISVVQWFSPLCLLFQVWICQDVFC